MSRLSLSSLVLLVACGSSEAPSGSELTVRFQLSKGGASGLVACKDVPEVSAVNVRVLGADGITPLSGFPKTADCATGRFDDSTIPEGSYTLELTAVGELFGDPAAVLFKVRTPLNLPADREVELALSPEVAFLALSWTFSPNGDLSPCAEEVDTISVFVGTGAAGSGTYQKTDLPCAAGTFAIPTPLLPQNYAVKLDAYAQGTGRKVYGVEEMRLLERGANPTFAVVFQPQGGRLVFDWQFTAPGGAGVTACDDARVGVSEVALRVTTAQGDEPIEVVIPCAAQRPFAVPGVRFTEGRMLHLELSAEGVHRFVSARDVVTRATDTDLGLLDLMAAGSATVTVTRTSSTACPPAVSMLGVSVTKVGERSARLRAELDPMGGSVPVVDVPLGDYDVRVEGKVGANVACSVESRESITARSNRWRPLEL